MEHCWNQTAAEDQFSGQLEQRINDLNQRIEFAEGLADRNKAELRDEIMQVSNEVSMTRDYTFGLHSYIVESGGYLRNDFGMFFLINSGFISQLWNVRIWLLRELWDQSNTCDWFVSVAIQSAVRTTLTVEMRKNQKAKQVIMTWRWNQQLHLQVHLQLCHRQLKEWWSV